MQGFVKFFDCKKGWGFITGRDDHADYFVHHTQIKLSGFKELFEGEQVEFDVGEDNKSRNRAENVKLINPRREKPDQPSMKEVLEKI